MALENIKVTFALENLFQYFGEDHASDSEPYMWVFMFKIDGETIYQEGNLLKGKPTYHYNVGSHGNLLGGESNPNGQRIDIPAGLGHWETSLTAIKVSIPVLVDFDAQGQPVYVNVPVEIPGIIGCVAVLLEENSASESAMESGHNAFIALLKNQFEKLIEKIDLEVLGYKVQKIVRDTKVTIAEASKSVLNGLIAETQANITEFAAPVVTYAILQKINFGGAVSPDVFLGQSVHIYDQELLASKSETYDWDKIHFIDYLFDNPSCPESGDWAYNLKGVIYPHIKYIPIKDGIPDTKRLEVSCIRRERNEVGYEYVNKIGGVYEGRPWNVTRSGAIEAINKGKHEFFTRGKGGAETKIYVNQGTKEINHEFLQTVGNETTDDNLLSLGNCPFSWRVVE
jgi:hypothetical protein